MKKRWFRLTAALMLLLSIVLPLPRAAAADAEYEYYSFQDRHRNTLYAPVDAFAVRVVSFTHGDPWTTHADNQDPAIALGLPDADSSADTGDLNLGGGGELVVELGLPVFDGPGNDLFVFEAGTGGAEEMYAAVSDDGETWYELGSLSGNVTEADLAGKTPEGMTFRYVRLTDSGNNNSGSWPGADIDAVCGLHTGADMYHFGGGDGTVYTVPVNAFAARVVDFTPGSPWTSYANDRKVENALGVPDYDDNDGELTLGGGGIVTLAFDVEIYDGPGLDIFVFEIADQVESTRIEVSQDLETWYEAGVSKGSFAGVDIAGTVPEDYGFSYVRLTDLRDYPNGGWPGADIDAVCGLHTRAKAAPAFPYRINSILIQNDTFRLTEEELTAAVSVTRTGEAEEAFVFFAVYDEAGRLAGSVCAVEAGEHAAGETFQVEFPVDNRGGTAAVLKAFILGPRESLTPLSYAFACSES